MRNMAASGDISRVEAAIFLGLTTYLHSSGINTSETIASESPINTLYLSILDTQPHYLGL